MFCLIHRWKIDRALDDNQELPRSTKTHIANCPNVSNVVLINKDESRLTNADKSQLIQQKLTCRQSPPLSG